MRTEEDLDDVVFEEEIPAPVEDNRWLLIAKVNTDREFSNYWFFKNMRSAWDLAQDMKTKTLEDNLFILKFSCLGDWEKVTQGGPWNFRGSDVLFAPYDGFMKPSAIELNSFDIWIQIHDLPFGYRGMIKSLSAKVGKFVHAELPSDDFAGNFFRVRVTLDVRNPLKNHVSLSRAGKREIFLVKYERLPKWCAVCGMLGHTYKEHGDGIHPPSALVFKNLKATRSMRQPARINRGRGRGRGPSDPRRGNRGARDDLGDGSDEEEDDQYSNDMNTEEVSAATQQNKEIVLSDPRVRKRLDLGQGKPQLGITLLDQSGNTISSIVDRIEEDPIKSIGTPSDQDKKRLRKSGDSGADASNNLGSADLQRGSDRAQ